MARTKAVDLEAESTKPKKTSLPTKFLPQDDVLLVQALLAIKERGEDGDWSFTTAHWGQIAVLLNEEGGKKGTKTVSNCRGRYMDTVSPLLLLLTSLLIRG
jgi:hypothetical protein